jgi:hypothetical protein
VRHLRQAHVLQRLGSQRRTPASGAEQHQLLVLREHRLVIRALGVDPELQHAARRMEGARYDAVALEFANVADVDELNVLATVQVACFFDAVGGDGGGGLVDHRLHGLLHALLQDAGRWVFRTARG